MKDGFHLMLWDRDSVFIHFSFIYFIFQRLYYISSFSFSQERHSSRNSSYSSQQSCAVDIKQSSLKSLLCRHIRHSYISWEVKIQCWARVCLEICDVETLAQLHHHIQFPIKTYFVWLRAIITFFFPSFSLVLSNRLKIRETFDVE